MGGIFALAVTRFLNPRIELALPTRPCVVRRQGQSHLSIRIVHPQGHLVSSMAVHAIWMRRKVTEEGEDFQASDPVSFNDNVQRYVWSCAWRSNLALRRPSHPCAQPHPPFLLGGSADDVPAHARCRLAVRRQP